MFPTDKNAALIKEEALRIGFDSVGIAKAERLDKEARQLEEWLGRGYHGAMGYMANHFEMRVDPRRLVEGARSVICLTHNYFPQKEQTENEVPKIARYAYGQDYHLVLKEKLRALLAFIRKEIGEVNGRCFVDSAPVMERQWAERAGLGWAGKNTLLIHPRRGSYFFLAEIILDLELAADHPLRDHCGTCRRCIEACPTEAIAADGYLLDASKCISYLTIELRDAIPEGFKNQMKDWAFGCDICQEVCPWNRFSTPHAEPDFEPHPDLLEMKKKAWEEITSEVFQKIFKKSAVMRVKFEGLKRNLRFLNE